jgi:hypothetical protein
MTAFAILMAIHFGETIAPRLVYGWLAAKIAWPPVGSFKLSSIDVVAPAEAKPGASRRTECSHSMVARGESPRSI